jgi:hypothetical protein
MKEVQEVQQGKTLAGMVMRPVHQLAWFLAQAWLKSRLESLMQGLPTLL